VGWVYLLSSSCSLLELLVGLPMAHPFLLPLFPKCVEEALSEVALTSKPCYIGRERSGGERRTRRCKRR